MSNATNITEAYLTKIEPQHKIIKIIRNVVNQRHVTVIYLYNDATTRYNWVRG